MTLHTRLCGLPYFWLSPRIWFDHIHVNMYCCPITDATVCLLFFLLWLFISDCMVCLALRFCFSIWSEQYTLHVLLLNRRSFCLPPSPALVFYLILRLVLLPGHVSRCESCVHIIAHLYIIYLCTIHATVLVWLWGMLFV